jgi:hypothetical protein
MDSVEDLAHMEVAAENTMETSEIVPNKLNIFGVSRLSTKEIQGFIQTMFSNASMEVRVEWIDDDTCNTVFESDELVSLMLSVGEIVLGADGEDTNQRSFTVPPSMEGEEPHYLIAKRATSADMKDPKRSWKESNYYKRKLEEKGINPVTLKPVSKVILKPRSGVKEPHQTESKKVSLIPRRLVNEARNVIYGDEAFSKRKSKKQESFSMDIDEEELARRNSRAQRFSSHRV